MARVKQEVIEATQDMISNLPPEHIATCGLCNRTLFDNLSVIANKTGAPEKTVAYAFADQYNKDKREEDQITGKAFYERLQYIHRANDKELKSDGGSLKPPPPEVTPPPDSLGVEIVTVHQPAASDITDDDEKDLKSESRSLNDAESGQSNVAPEDEMEDTIAVAVSAVRTAGEKDGQSREPYIIPLETTQVEIVKLLVDFYKINSASSNEIRQTLLMISEVCDPIGAERYEKGTSLSFKDLPGVLGGLIQNSPMYYDKISEAILEGLIDHSTLSPAGVKSVVQLMHDEVCIGDLEEEPQA
jgi:hypothetical protein